MFKISKDDHYYKKAIEHEGRQWGQSTHEPNVHQSLELNPLLRGYQNELITGDAKRDWAPYVLERYGPFATGCSLGSGLGQTEEEFIANGKFTSFVCYDVSADALKKMEGTLSKHPGIRCEFKTADLNFMELPENHYDFILCNNILHHLINLEHVLYQISKALTPNGKLVIRDYIGEDRFQWDPRDGQ